MFVPYFFSEKLAEIEVIGFTHRTSVNNDNITLPDSINKDTCIHPSLNGFVQEVVGPIHNLRIVYSYNYVLLSIQDVNISIA